MRRTVPIYILMFFAILGLAGCELAGDVLKVGFWMGVVVLVVVLLALWSLLRFFRRRTRP